MQAEQEYLIPRSVDAIYISEETRYEIDHFVISEMYRV